MARAEGRLRQQGGGQQREEQHTNTLTFFLSFFSALAVLGAPATRCWLSGASLDQPQRASAGSQALWGGGEIGAPWG